MLASQFSENSDKSLILNNYSPAHSNPSRQDSLSGPKMIPQRHFAPAPTISSRFVEGRLKDSHKCFIMNKLHINRFVNHFLVSCRR